MSFEVLRDRYCAAADGLRHMRSVYAHLEAGGSMLPPVRERWTAEIGRVSCFVREVEHEFVCGRCVSLSQIAQKAKLVEVLGEDKSCDFQSLLFHAICRDMSDIFPARSGQAD